MNPHRTDIVSLVFGLLFLGVSAMWPLIHYEVLGLPGLGVAVPVLLISVGLAGLLASLNRIRRGDPDERDSSSRPR